MIKQCNKATLQTIKVSMRYAMRVRGKIKVCALINDSINIFIWHRIFQMAIRLLHLCSSFALVILISITTLALLFIALKCLLSCTSDFAQLTSSQAVFVLIDLLKILFPRSSCAFSTFSHGSLWMMDIERAHHVDLVSRSICITQALARTHTHSIAFQFRQRSTVVNVRKKF